VSINYYSAIGDWLLAISNLLRRPLQLRDSRTVNIWLECITLGKQIEPTFISKNSVNVIIERFKIKNDK
jgi:hypothetical protein